MKVEIIPLALKKIKLRGIPLKWVEETADNPDQIVPGYGGRRGSLRKFIVRMIRGFC